MPESGLIAAIRRLLAQKIGLHIPEETEDRFVSTVQQRAAKHASLAAYHIFLQGNQSSAEWALLARLFSTGETYFFRDHGQFDLLRLRLLPELIAGHRDDKRLSLWSAACASGEEAYSLAMLVDMLLPAREGWKIDIFGTDIDTLAIEKAKAARYGLWSFRMVPDEIKQRYFHEEFEGRNPQWTKNPQSVTGNPQAPPGTGHFFVLDERIRSMVQFCTGNLLDDTGMHDMDLILCRNVFIYFDPVAILTVANKLALALRAGGYLMSAHTELNGYKLPELESRLFAESLVYQRRTLAFVEPAIRRVPLRDAIRPAPATKGLLPASSVINQHARDTLKSSVKAYGLTQLKLAQRLAEQGEFEQAELLCNEILAADTLASSVYFLLAQLAEVKGDVQKAILLLSKALYIDHDFVAAHLEMAALFERAGNISRAHALRQAALKLVRAMPADEIIVQYETTANELALWLAKWE